MQERFKRSKVLYWLVGVALVASLVGAPPYGQERVAQTSGTFSFWDDSTVPATASHNDSNAVEVGIKFSASSNGTINAIRFYKGSSNTGTHIGNLWSSTGILLAQATFTNETASGWQQVNFATPVQITANTTYVASYFAPNGHYARNVNYFTSPLVSGPLTAPAGANGVYKYTSTSAFPAQSFQSTNYWVDIVFVPQSTGDTLFPSTAVPETASNNDSNAVEVGVKFSASTNGTINAIRFYKGSLNTGTHVGHLWNSTGALLAQATFTDETASGWQQVDFAPVQITANTTYVASYFAPVGRHAQNVNYFTTPLVSGPLTAPAGANGVYKYGPTSAFPTETFQSTNYWVDIVFVPQSTGDTLFPSTAVPATASHSDSNAVEVGVKFSASTNGTINAIRFYKGSLNTGTHVGHLWNSTGTLLAQATFTNETASGWQQVDFAPPVAITTNTTYVASYFAPVGRYARNVNYFATPLVNGPLTAPAGANGVYKYGSTPAFPTETFQSTNYWVDVVFTPRSCPAASIICTENLKPGNPSSEWDISGAGSSNIVGFATQMSVNKGETVQFKVNTNSSDYRLDIYRIGYYGGNGARKITTIQPSTALPQTQPACLTDSAVGLTDCGNWSVSASWAVPADAVSGVYIAKLVREDGTVGSNHIIFVVRDDTGNSDVLVQTSDAAWQAYNIYGGSSLYTGPVTRGYKVSYNRPFMTRGSEICCTGSVPTWFFNSEYPLVWWLEQNGYNVSYTTNIDTASRGSEILEHKVFISSGHDEYWSNEMRTNVENARNNGVHLIFLSGNEIFWKTRWEGALGTGTPFRTLVCYKETLANAKIDPSPDWTGAWMDPRFSPPADGGRPQNALTGTLYRVNGARNDSMDVPYEFGQLRLWRNTSVANLSPGQVATFEEGIMGYEWDEAPDDAVTPPGLVRYSLTSRDIVGKYLISNHYGASYGDGTAIHSLTMYKHSSGAQVFGAGTTQWAWGLSATHDRAGTSADVRIQQATVNLLTDMGAQPATLQAGLVPGTASTDTTPPTSAITSPADGATITVGTPTVIQGIASDVGGVVGAVEVSLDNGATWLHATGMANWQFTWIPTVTGTYTIRARAVDDSGNLQTATPDSRTVTVVPAP